ncbi:hypothetical protein NX059_012029 [Plenodomus lindquistii]|nr:hypothetical protein NX059_012029 [Plenodomus lindquistii]
MNQFPEDLVRKHFEAKKMYDIKIAKLQPRIFPSGRLPTLNDIYLGTDSTYVPTVPDDMQLNYYFANFAELERLKFQAHKYEPGVHHQMAIFQWELDQQHSFSSAHGEIRLNVLLALLCLAIPTERAKLEQSLERFLRVFIVAWRDMAMRTPANNSWAYKEFVGKYWKHSKYDLIKFTKQPRVRMSALVRQLEARVPPPQCNIEDFWETARLKSAAELEAHGAAWAMQAIVHREKMGETKDQ